MIKFLLCMTLRFTKMTNDIVDIFHIATNSRCDIRDKYLGTGWFFLDVFDGFSKIVFHCLWAPLVAGVISSYLHDHVFESGKIHIANFFPVHPTFRHLSSSRLSHLFWDSPCLFFWSIELPMIKVDGPFVFLLSWCVSFRSYPWLS